ELIGLSERLGAAEAALVYRTAARALIDDLERAPKAQDRNLWWNLTVFSSRFDAPEAAQVFDRLALALERGSDNQLTLNIAMTMGAFANRIDGDQAARSCAKTLITLLRKCDERPYGDGCRSSIAAVAFLSQSRTGTSSSLANELAVTAICLFKDND